ncbi:MAG: hypothetical protein EXS37_20770 [Opitutus sp.]|nr:hypothetical protein [Opitutus sp.]
MHSEQIRQLRYWFGGFMLLFFGAIYGYMYFAQSHRLNRIAAQGERRELAPDGSPRVQQLYQLTARDPEGALKVADAIIAKPQSDYERRVAMGQRPSLLKSATIKRLEAGERAEAQRLRDRLEKTYPASDQVGWMRNDWNRVLANMAAKSLVGGDRATADAAFGELWALDGGEAVRYAFDQRYEASLRRWHRAQNPAEPNVTELMFETLEVFPRVSYLDQAANSMTQSPGTSEELAALGDAQLKTERRHVAVVLWAGALAKLDSGSVDRRERNRPDPKLRAAVEKGLKAKIAGGWMELGDRLHAGERIPYVLISARDAYAAAIERGRGLVEEMEALTKLIAFETADATRLAEPLLALTFEQLRDPAVQRQDAFKDFDGRVNRLATQIRDVIRDRGVRLWECCLETPGFDPWPTVPAAVREALDSSSAVSATRTPPDPIKSAATVPTRARSRNQPKNQPSTPATVAAPAADAVTTPAASGETERRKKLAEHYRTDFWQIPLAEVDPLGALARQLYARSAILGLSGDAEAALIQLRWMLRAKEDAPLQKSIVETLRARLVLGRQANDFNQYYALAGFYAAEVGLPAAGDPFRNEFRTGLEAAAKGFKTSEKMKRIFTLSLLAQCFPDEPVGKQARVDAFAAAFETVAARPASKFKADLKEVWGQRKPASVTSSTPLPQIQTTPRSRDRPARRGSR